MKFQEADGGAAQLREAVERLVEILDGLPTFEPCRGPVKSWPEDLRKKRFPVWDLGPEHWQGPFALRIKETWSAYGKGCLILCDNARLTPILWRVPGSATPEMQPAIARVLAARAESLPEGVRDALLRGWAANSYDKEGLGEPEVFVRNDWHERRVRVAVVRPEIERLLPAAIRAVRRSGSGDVGPLEQIKTDDVLHYETIDAAIAQLTFALPNNEEARSDSGARGVPAYMTGRQAAETIGVREATLSGWRREAPAWAGSNPMLFQFLMDRSDGKYVRHSVLKLASWFKKAQTDGAHSPVDCP